MKWRAKNWTMVACVSNLTSGRRREGEEREKERREGEERGGRGRRGRKRGERGRREEGGGGEKREEGRRGGGEEERKGGGGGDRKEEGGRGGRGGRGGSREEGWGGRSREEGGRREKKEGEKREGKRERRNYLFFSYPPLLQFCLQVELVLIVVSSCPGTGLSLGKKTSLHGLLLVMLLLSHLLEEGREEKTQGEGRDA